MATTTTSKIAEAISLLSDALSTEVAATQDFLDDAPEETVPAEIHEGLQSVVEDFTTEILGGLEDVQTELQTAVGSEDDDDDGAPGYWPADFDDEEYRQAGEEFQRVVDNYSGDETTETTDTDDETAPSDEEKVETLVAARDELQEQIDEHENTIEELKTTLGVCLDGINDLVQKSETFRDQAEEF